MRIRWIALALISGLALAYWDASLLMVHLTGFACLVLFGIRRIESAINNMSEKSQNLATRMTFVGEIVERSLALMPKAERHRDIYAGDAAARELVDPRVVKRGVG